MIFHKEEYDRRRREDRESLLAFGWGEVGRSFVGLGIVGSIMLMSWLGGVSSHGIEYMLGIPMLIVLAMQLLVLATKPAVLKKLDQ